MTIANDPPVPADDGGSPWKTFMDVRPNNDLWVDVQLNDGEVIYRRQAGNLDWGREVDAGRDIIRWRLVDKSGVIGANEPFDTKEDNYGAGPGVTRAPEADHAQVLFSAFIGAQLDEYVGTTYRMDTPGYNMLAEVLVRAYNQAAVGKGHERHSNGEPFDEQVMADMARRFGVGALLAQAFKKSEESQRLPHDRSIAELLGAINYLAGAIIHMEKKHADQS